jgi:hypothetical protein
MGKGAVVTKDKKNDDLRPPGAQQEASPEGWLVGGGEMGAIMRATDWSKTKLGPVVSERLSRTSCSLAAVVVEQSAETRPASDLGGNRVVVAWRCLRPDDLAADPLVGALGQVVLQELLDQVPQVTLAENDEVVQTLGSDRLYETLRVRVLSENRIGRAMRRPGDSGSVRRRGVRGVGSLPCLSAQEATG